MAMRKASFDELDKPKRYRLKSFLVMLKLPRKTQYKSLSQWWDIGKIQIKLFCQSYSAYMKSSLDNKIAQLEQEILRLNIEGMLLMPLSLWNATNFFCGIYWRKEPRKCLFVQDF